MDWNEKNNTYILEFIDIKKSIYIEMSKCIMEIIRQKLLWWTCMENDHRFHITFIYGEFLWAQFNTLSPNYNGFGS